MPPRKRPAQHAIDVALGMPWAITREALATILGIAARQNPSPEVIAAKLGRPLENTRRVTVRDGVASVPVRGPLFRYANLFTELSGATSYEVLAREFTAALEDPGVIAIVLDIDSPGGELNGVAELADLVYGARGKKPIIAHVSGAGASGAYWLASAADEVVAAETGILGSIGTVMRLVDTTEAEEREGIRTIEIVSSQSPKKRLDPSEDAGRAQVQQVLDDLAAVFIGAVARNRGVTEAKVAADFGQGGVFVGAAAVEAGLADRLATFEEVQAALAAGAAPSGGITVNAQRGDIMAAETKTLQPKVAEGDEDPKCATCDHAKSAHDGACTAEGCDCSGYKAPGEQATQPAPAAAAATPAPAPAAAAPAVDAVARERERILAIEKLDGPKELVQRCKEDPACTVEQAALRINEAQKATREARVTALKNDEATLQAPAPLDPAATEATSDDALARQIVATGQMVFGRPKPTTPADRS